MLFSFYSSLYNVFFIVLCVQINKSLILFKFFFFLPRTIFVDVDLPINFFIVFSSHLVSLIFLSSIRLAIKKENFAKKKLIFLCIYIIITIPFQARRHLRIRSSNFHCLIHCHHRHHQHWRHVAFSWCRWPWCH